MAGNRTIIERIAAGEKVEGSGKPSVIGEVVAKNGAFRAAERDALAAKLSDERSYDGIPAVDKNRLFPKALELVQKYNGIKVDKVGNERDITFVSADLKDIAHEIETISEFYGGKAKRITELHGLAVKLGENGIVKDLAKLGKQLEEMKANPFYSPKREKEADDLRREFFGDALFAVQEKFQMISEKKTGDYPRFD